MSRRKPHEQPRRENRCCTCLEGCLDIRLWWSTVTAPCREIAALTALLTLFGTAPGVADPAAPTPRGAAARDLYSAVARYRYEISPKLPARCPYTPTCSTYAIKALHTHGALRGGLLAVRRLLRCTPERARRRGGLDPVPPARSR
ncbi:membrane protein insertion efficiency factor YidD [Streptomyces sp. NPDC059866]|uniref:membrane protein insertion efficiency factor YidD n=1 Tax=Streptomyces sp. NPDC059866 TaxID=3346978 RepID=UPI00365EBFFB